MLGDDIQDIIQDVQDAVGEITNMVSGQARAGLAEQGLTFSGSTPSVIMGDNHTIAHISLLLRLWPFRLIPMPGNLQLNFALSNFSTNEKKVSL